MTAMTPAADTEPSDGQHPDFVDIDEIRTADQIYIIISQRRDSGRLTWGLFRRFMRDDRWKRSSFMGEILLPAAIQAMTIAQEVMEKIRKDGHPKLVKPVPPLGD